MFDPPTEETCWTNYAEGARCGRPKKHDGRCSQVSRWVTTEQEDSFVPASPATVSDVLRRYATWLDTQGAGIRSVHAVEINACLDQLLRADAFGTEGQCDPRGDPRP